MSQNNNVVTINLMANNAENAIVIISAIQCWLSSYVAKLKHQRTFEVIDMNTNKYRVPVLRIPQSTNDFKEYNNLYEKLISNDAPEKLELDRHKQINLRFLIHILFLTLLNAIGDKFYDTKEAAMLGGALHDVDPVAFEKEYEKSEQEEIQSHPSDTQQSNNTYPDISSNEHVQVNPDKSSNGILDLDAKDSNVNFTIIMDALSTWIDSFNAKVDNKDSFIESIYLGKIKLPVYKFPQNPADTRYNVNLYNKLADNEPKQIKMDTFMQENLIFVVEIFNNALSENLTNHNQNKLKLIIEGVLDDLIQENSYNKINSDSHIKNNSNFDSDTIDSNFNSNISPNSDIAKPLSYRDADKDNSELIGTEPKQKVLKESEDIIINFNHDSHGGGQIDLASTMGLQVLLTNFSMSINAYNDNQKGNSKSTFHDYLSNHDVTIPLTSFRCDPRIIQLMSNQMDYFNQNQPKIFNVTRMDAQVMGSNLDTMIDVFDKFFENFKSSHEHTLISILANSLAILEYN